MGRRSCYPSACNHSLHTDVFKDFFQQGATGPQLPTGLNFSLWFNGGQLNRIKGKTLTFSDRAERVSVCADTLTSFGQSHTLTFHNQHMHGT